MGIDAKLQTEDGKTIEEVFDPQSLFQRLLPFDDERSSCLRFVDPYGDTTFNQRQIPFLVKELEIAIKNLRDADAKKQGEKVLRLVKKATDEPHVYIKFIGD